MNPIFLSHGSPMLVLEATPTTAFLRDLGRRIGKPRAVVAISAHWETERPMVGGAARPATIHDFRGFPRALYEMHYPAPGDPAVARQAAGMLDCSVDAGRGLDHGIWCPAALLWPDADVPIVPLSVQPGLGAAHHAEIGRRLRPLAAEGVLVLGTGALTHNLSAYGGQPVAAPVASWVAEFADWMAEAVAQGRTDDLLAWRERAPFAADNHPTGEHLLPLFVALGATNHDRGGVLHRAVEYGVLAMDAYRF